MLDAPTAALDTARGRPPSGATVTWAHHHLPTWSRHWRNSRRHDRAVLRLPGPASTQLAIFCAWRLRGRIGAVIGGVCFIVPGLILILALSAVFLTSNPSD